MKHIFFIFLLFNFILANNLTEDEKINSLIELYENGECEKVIDEFNNLLPSLQNKENKIIAHRYLGFCYFLMGKKEEAKFEFVEMLKLNPSIKFDPSLVLPEVIELLNQAKKIKKLIDTEIKITLASIPQQSQSQNLKPISYWNFLPLGIVQFKKDKKIKAVCFTTIQILAIGTTIFAYNDLNKQYNNKFQGYLDNKKAEKTLQLMQISFITAIGSYLISIIDGIFDN